jgi:hypothetical protein
MRGKYHARPTTVSPPFMSTDTIQLSRRQRTPSRSEARVENDGRRASVDAARRLHSERTELRVSPAASGLRPGGLLGAVQAGVAVAQAGLAEARALGSAADAPTAAGPRRVPLLVLGSQSIAEALMAHHQAAGSDLQAWLDIATGRLALEAVAQALAQSAPSAPEPEAARAFEPAGEPVTELDAQPGPGAALEQARASFDTALQRFDRQLAALGTQAGRTPPQPDPRTAARRAATQVVREPVQAQAAHGAVSLPGVLSLLQWDLTPLDRPVEPVPAPVLGAGQLVPAAEAPGSGAARTPAKSVY